MLHNNIRTYLQNLMQGAGAIALSAFQKHFTDYSLKSDLSYLTKTDKQIDNYIHARVEKDFPNYNLYSEESNQNWDENIPTFILDPIDGTTNFFFGVPSFGPQIALWQDKRLIAAALYDPIAKIMVSASEKNGVFLNNTKVSLKSQPLNQITLLFDTGRDQQIARKFFRSNLHSYFRSYRRFGSLITDTIFLCQHFYSAYFGFTSKLYDFAPAACVLGLAGYHVFDQTFKPWHPSTTNSLYALPPDHSHELLPLLTQLIGEDENEI